MLGVSLPNPACFCNSRCGVCLSKHSFDSIKRSSYGKKEKRSRIKRKTGLLSRFGSYARRGRPQREENGLSVSEFCRLALINHPIEKQPVIIHDERKTLQELRNINSVVVNLDQIVQHLNEGGKNNDALLQMIRETLKTLDISINDFNQAVEEEYGPSC